RSDGDRARTIRANHPPDSRRAAGFPPVHAKVSDAPSVASENERIRRLATDALANQNVRGISENRETASAVLRAPHVQSNRALAKVHLRDAQPEQFRFSPAEIAAELKH